MKNYLIISALTVILLLACKGEKDRKGEKDAKKDAPLSALSIIKGQLNNLETSIYEVKKFETIDNVTDSSYLKKEDIRKAAAPFLSLPEIADEKYYEKYTEDKVLDAQQNILNITTIAKSDTTEIQKQFIIVDISPTTDNKVQSIYIDRYISKGDSTLEQKLFWEIDKSFLIRSITGKKDQPEKVHSIKVMWQ